jgi:hypothetical protein
MTEPDEKAEDTLEADVDAAIALCDGVVRAALRPALVYNDFLERNLETMRGWFRRATHAARSRPVGPPVRSLMPGGTSRAVTVISS